MKELIKICDVFDIRFLQVKYNDDEGEACAPASADEDTKSITSHLTIDGMTCSACSLAITQQLEALVGVHRASVSLALARATISYDFSKITPASLIGAVQKAGYDATLENLDALGTIERLNQTQDLHDMRQAISSASVCSTTIALLNYIPAVIKHCANYPYFTSFLVWIALLLAFKVQVSSAWPIHSRAWSSGRRKMTMETLLSLSLLLGLGLALFKASAQETQKSIAYASSSSFLTIVVLSGRYLEAVLKRESHRNLVTLYELKAERELYRLVNSEVSKGRSD